MEGPTYRYITNAVEFDAPASIILRGYYWSSVIKRRGPPGLKFALKAQYSQDTDLNHVIYSVEILG